MTAADWGLIRRIESAVRRQAGLTDADLVKMLGVPGRELRAAVAVLYRQGRVDRCGAYLVPGTKAGAR